MKEPYLDAKMQVCKPGVHEMMQNERSRTPHSLFPQHERVRRRSSNVHMEGYEWLAVNVPLVLFMCKTAQIHMN